MKKRRCRQKLEFMPRLTVRASLEVWAHSGVVVQFPDGVKRRVFLRQARAMDALILTVEGLSFSLTPQ